MAFIGISQGGIFASLDASDSGRSLSQAMQRMMPLWLDPASPLVVLLGHTEVGITELKRTADSPEIECCPVRQ